MALVVFLRGVNVGGHRTFRPSILAQELSEHGVVNIGAAGTFVVRTPGSRATFRDALHRRLPFETESALCNGRDVAALVAENPFAGARPRRDIVQFVSVLARAARARPELPMTLPEGGPWGVRILGSRDRFVFGEYRRQMKAIGHLARIDTLFGAPATTRNWSTIVSIARILNDEPAR